MSMKCPRCGQGLDTAGRPAGTHITCPTCGNVTAVASNSRTLLFVLLGIGGVVLACPCIGMAAAVAIPNFMRYQGRAKQSECKANLKAWYLAQRVRTEEGFSPLMKKVGFSPERANRYAYFAGPGPIEDRGGPEARGGEDVEGIGVDLQKYPTLQPITLEQLPADVAREVGVHGSQCPEGPDCSITAVCAGNIDRDDTLDVWSISTEDRVGPDGEHYTAGEPIQHVDDLKL